MIVEGKINDQNFMMTNPNIADVALSLEEATNETKTLLKLYTSLFPEVRK